MKQNGWHPDNTPEALHLHLSGVSISHIAQEFKCSRKTVWHHLRKCAEYAGKRGRPKKGARYNVKFASRMLSVPLRVSV